MNGQEVIGTSAELDVELGAGTALTDTAMRVAAVVDQIAADEDL